MQCERGFSPRGCRCEGSVDFVLWLIPEELADLDADDGKGEDMSEKRAVELLELIEGDRGLGEFALKDDDGVPKDEEVIGMGSPHPILVEEFDPVCSGLEPKPDKLLSKLPLVAKPFRCRALTPRRRLSLLRR